MGKAREMFDEGFFPPFESLSSTEDQKMSQVNFVRWSSRVIYSCLSDDFFKTEYDGDLSIEQKATHLHNKEMKFITSS
jgi:hypothetical protein